MFSMNPAKCWQWSRAGDVICAMTPAASHLTASLVDLSFKMSVSLPMPLIWNDPWKFISVINSWTNIDLYPNIKIENERLLIYKWHIIFTFSRDSMLSATQHIVATALNVVAWASSSLFSSQTLNNSSIPPSYEYARNKCEFY